MRVTNVAREADSVSSVIDEARKRARDRGRPVLAVHSERAPAFDPLACMEYLSAATAREPWLDKQVALGRTYWARPSDRFALAAIGAAVTFSPSGPARFRAVDAGWADVVKNAVVSAPAADIPGVGPVLMGGFSFDADGPGGGRWRDFPSTHLVVPRLLLTSSRGECWITVASVTDPKGESDTDADMLLRLRDAALAGIVAPPALDCIDPAADAPTTRIEYSGQRSAADWANMIRDAVAEIRRGSMEKVVLARAVTAIASRDLDPFEVVRQLRSIFHDAFTFCFWRGESAFVGASPERLARLDGLDVSVSALAGTTPRGATREEDASAGQMLLESAKDRSEQALARDFIVSALAAACDDVAAPSEPSLLTLPHVHHLHTGINARLRADRSFLDIVEALHPTPAVGGLPRHAALSFIREHEQLDRGWYAGPVGWIGAGSAEFAVALRSAVVNGPEAVLFAGCGIVADSDPVQELAESDIKLRSVQSAIETSLACRKAEYLAASGEPS